MPPDFDFPEQQKLWFPFPWDPGSLTREQGRVWVWGRLRPGVERPVAEQEMTSIVAQLARAYADTNRPATVRAEPLSRMFLGDEERRILGAMMASGFFVLLIACANVANLLLARATGVVPDLLMGGDSERIPEGLHVYPAPGTMGGGYLLLKTRGDPLILAPALLEEIGRIDPDQPISRLGTLDDFIQEAFWLLAILGSIFTGFGLSALFLAAVGLYGVMANSVTQRTREMGIRRALGADSSSILTLVLKAGLRQVVPGLALGGGLAFLASRSLAVILFRVEPRDPVTFVAVAGVRLTVGLLAALVPAIRATRMDPVEALREE